MTPLENWLKAWAKFGEEWDRNNPRPPADHPGRVAWMKKRETDGRAWQKAHPAPEPTSEEKSEVEGLRALNRRLCP